MYILPHFFDENTFKKICQEVEKYPLYADRRLSQRKSISIPQNSLVHKLVYSNAKMKRFINELFSSDWIVDFPIEYREYFTGSKGMPMHSDTPMYTKPHWEFVLTLGNTSDSKFQWVENGQLKGVKPMANTLVAVQSGDVRHGVTPINKGKRTILKFIVRPRTARQNWLYTREIDQMNIDFPTLSNKENDIHLKLKSVHNIPIDQLKKIVYQKESHGIYSFPGGKLICK